MHHYEIWFSTIKEFFNVRRIILNILQLSGTRSAAQSFRVSKIIINVFRVLKTIYWLLNTKLILEITRLYLIPWKNNIANKNMPNCRVRPFGVPKVKIKSYLVDDLSPAPKKGCLELEFEFFILKSGAAFCMFLSSVRIRVAEIDIIFFSC